MKAEVEVFTLKLEREYFEKILNEYPEIGVDLMEKAKTRELYMHYFNQMNHKDYLSRLKKNIMAKLVEAFDEYNYQTTRNQEIEAL